MSKYKKLVTVAIIIFTSIACGQENPPNGEKIKGIDIPPGGSITIRTVIDFVGAESTTSAGITDDALSELLATNSTGVVRHYKMYTEKDLWALGAKVDSIAILYKHTHSSSGRWSIHIDDACGIVGLDFVERGNDLDELINRTLTKYYNEVCCK